MKDAKMLEGKWKVARMPELADDYLALSPDPHVHLRSSTSKKLHGTYDPTLTVKINCALGSPIFYGKKIEIAKSNDNET